MDSPKRIPMNFRAQTKNCVVFFYYDKCKNKIKKS
jgi:hypothetical protein